MKKIIFIVFINSLFFTSCTILNTGVTTDKYYKSYFGTENTTWNVAFEGIDAYLTESFKASKVKVKDGFRSAIINERYALKENINSSKLWLIDNDNHREYLLVDMDLKKGNKFQISKDEVGIVDSIYEINGNKGIRLSYQFVFNNEKQYLTFIEGIGPNASFYYNTPQVERQEQLLLCVQKDEHLVSINYPRINNCQYFANSMPPIPPKVEYDSSSKKIHCLFNDVFSGSVMVENSKGEKLEHFSINDLPYLGIDILGLPNDTYTIIISNLQETLSKSFITIIN